MNSGTKQLALSSIFNAVKESQIFWILSFSALTAIAAQITIPVKPVPFTLQTMIVILAGAFLGARNGFYSQIIYLLIGATGLPVFAHTPEAGFGLARLIGPTGGYLLAFPLAAFVVGYLVQKNKKYYSVVISMFLGAIIILACGTLYLNFAYRCYRTSGLCSHTRSRLWPCTIDRTNRRLLACISSGRICSWISCSKE